MLSVVHVPPARLFITHGFFLRQTFSGTLKCTVRTLTPTSVCRHYSAKQMTLVVLGKESLTELQTTVEEKFSPVPNRGSGLRPSLKWIGTVKPFLSDKPLQAFNVVPVKVARGTYFFVSQYCVWCMPFNVFLYALASVVSRRGCVAGQ